MQKKNAHSALMVFSSRACVPVYCQGEVVVTIHPHNAPFVHNGIVLNAVGSVQLRLSDNSVGVFEVRRCRLTSGRPRVESTWLSTG